MHDKINGSVKEIIRGNDCQVYCQCVVDLISRRQRPYLFRVTVWGQPPHTVRRIYDIAAKDDNTAAQKGIDLFVKEMSHPLSIFGAMV
jgi:hypothetical protein